jgi:cellobiose-specific phosphotransferase system component IIA
MNKKIIIIIIVLIASVSISGCINSGIDNINNIVPGLTQSIEDGGLNFNEAVQYSNKQDYVSAEEKIQVASTSFLDAQNKILEIKRYYDDINDTLYLQYINLIEKELELKQNATAHMQLAIQSFRDGKKVLANEYVRKANNMMNEATFIQNQRENLVKNNPDKFK